MDTNKKSFRSSNRGGNGRRSFKGVGFVALLLLFGMVIFAAYNQSGTLKNIPLTQAIADANKNQYSKIEVSGNEMSITKKGDSQATIKSFIWIMMIRLPYAPDNLLLQCSIFATIAVWGDP